MNVRPSILVPILLAVLVGALPGPAAGAEPAPGVAEDGRIELFEVRSELLTAFWGREVTMQAGVVLPPGWDPSERWGICYDIHGFGGNHRTAWRRGPRLLERMKDQGYPRMIYVYLNAQCPMGHHEFADSVNNGPWGEALTTELVPALESKFSPKGRGASDRFLTGHSSGGWSSLWLQVTYPDFWNGTWSTAPDSVDFRDFTGINVYEWDNAYVDPDGNEIQLMRRGTQWVRSIRQFAAREKDSGRIGGQWYSFDAVFSPRAPDGTPKKMHDWETGKIDKSVVEYWKRYDIGLILRTRWQDLGPRLQGKLNVYCGTLDTFRLEGAVKLLKADLERLGSDATIVLAEGRDHGSVAAPHPEHWPQGMLHRIHTEMLAKFEGRPIVRPTPAPAPALKKRRGVLY